MKLPPAQQLVAAGKWPVVGERSAAPGSDSWTLEIAGLCKKPRVHTLGELRQMPQVDRTVDIHCVTRWSKPGCQFSGVPLLALLDAADLQPQVRFVSFLARSTRSHSTSLAISAICNLEPLVALDYERQPLPPGHGGPVRLIVPGRYFYKSLKWLTRIELLAEDRLGYWEATAGYHNEADPWLEQRYMATTLSRHEAAALLARRDFSGLDLRGIDARRHNLEGLVARAALLRDADFRGCNLRRANFAAANLSNARLQGADLCGASFAAGDVEGADFSGADLRGADFRGASVFGATFIDPDQQLAASIDRTTQFEPGQLDELLPLQSEFVQAAIKS